MGSAKLLTSSRFQIFISKMVRGRLILSFVLLLCMQSAWCFQIRLATGPMTVFAQSRLQLRTGAFVLPDLPLLDSISDAISELKDKWDSLPPVSYNDIQNAAVVSAGLTLLALEKRPRGSVRDNLVEVRKSTLIKNNLGVFSKAFIPEGTILGEYPGFVRSMESVYRNKVDDAARASAGRYLWETGSGDVLDPTNARGLVDLELKYFFGLKKVSTTLARLNEPPKGSDVNCIVKVAGSTVTVIAERNIFNNEELFIDYGPTFDRSDYPRNQSPPVQDVDMDDRKKIKIEPIVSSTSDANSGTPALVTTARKDGFLSQLAQNEAKYASSGILSPTDASKRFSAQGEAVFASAEDQELINSMCGKTDTTGRTGYKKAKSTVPTVEDKKEFVGDMDDTFGLAEQLASIVGKDGASDALLIETNSAFSPPARVPRPSVFEQRRASTTERSSAAGAESNKTSALSSAMAAKGVNKDAAAVARSTPNQVEGGNDVPPLSSEQAAALQRQLDSLTDEQVEQVFKRLRVSSMEKLVQQGLQQHKDRKTLSTLPESAAPRPVPPLDATVREKYNAELGQVEDVLQDLYKDPMSVWRELLKNPDKYTEKYADEDGNPLPAD